MPDNNINFNSESTKVKIQTVKNDIQTKLANRTTDYDTVLTSFAVSECMQATAVRSLIEKEKELVDALVSFYTNLLLMLEEAGNDIDETETTYSSSHLTNE